MRVFDHGQKNSLFYSLLWGIVQVLLVSDWIIPSHPVRDSLEFTYALFGRTQRVRLTEKFIEVHRRGIALQLAAARKKRLLQSAASALEVTQLARPIAIPLK